MYILYITHVLLDICQLVEAPQNNAHSRGTNRGEGLGELGNGVHLAIQYPTTPHREGDE